MKTLTHLLIDGSQGIYVPQYFASHCNPENSYWVWDYQNDKEVLSNPENELYWETWEDVLNTAYWIDPSQGIKYNLHQDGDVWMVREGFYMTEDGTFNDEGEQVDDEGKVIVRMKCDQCNMFSVNGHALHEQGCPNDKKKWVVEDGEGKWVAYVKCFECGFEVEEGSVCDCREEIESED